MRLEPEELEAEGNDILDEAENVNTIDKTKSIYTQSAASSENNEGQVYVKIPVKKENRVAKKNCGTIYDFRYFYS